MRAYTRQVKETQSTWSPFWSVQSMVLTSLPVKEGKAVTEVSCAGGEAGQW